MSGRGRVVMALVGGVLIGSAFVSPVGAHFVRNTRHLGAHAWQEFIRDRVYTRTQTDARFYRKPQADALFLTKTAAGDTYYSKGEADDRFLEQTDGYTKAQSDARYYRRTDADARFMRHLGELPHADAGVDIGWNSGFPTIVLGTVDVPDDCGRGLTRHTLAIDVTMNAGPGVNPGTGYVIAQLSPKLDGEFLDPNVFAHIGGSGLDRSATTHIRPVVPDVPPGPLEVSLKMSSIQVSDADDPPSLTLLHRYGAVTSLGFTCVQL